MLLYTHIPNPYPLLLVVLHRLNSYAVTAQYEGALLIPISAKCKRVLLVWKQSSLPREL